MRKSKAIELSLQLAALLSISQILPQKSLAQQRVYDSVVDASSAQSVFLVVRGVDDRAECVIRPDNVVLKSVFGSSASLDLTDRLRRRGTLIVDCSIYDNQLGKCYAYDIDILVDGIPRVQGRKGTFSCCSEICSAQVTTTSDPVRRLSFLIKK